MGWGAGRTTTVSFPQRPIDVYNALTRIGPGVDGLGPAMPHPESWMVMFSKGVGLTSWGERVTAQVTQGPDGRTWVTITSVLEVGLVDVWGKNDDHVNAICNALCAQLGQALVVRPLGDA
ncbi:hypothetical protein JS531_01170 [Bifidobacterium sp. CP2]|uniref:hypothetical protein n=1 Tax=Bifidobacterium TaxID=1678 RepID=UPI001BDCA86B|nr:MULTISPECIES: hypothetical protein [Bifidobacterium]MBT1180608.1 hypothetical protein [Bifidobacterium sp. CP2]MBW3080453.1 hypothetical protein [Bifidobacterium saguinibicoloris]